MNSGLENPIPNQRIEKEISPEKGFFGELVGFLKTLVGKPREKVVHSSTSEFLHDSMVRQVSAPYRDAREPRWTSGKEEYPWRRINVPYEPQKAADEIGERIETNFPPNESPK